MKKNKVVVNAKNIGRNCGCGDCGNERVDLCSIEPDAIPSRKGWGWQYLCKRCVKELAKKDNIKIVVA